MIHENIRRTVSVLLFAVTAAMPFSAMAMSSTPDEAVRVSTPDSAVHIKKAPEPSGSSSGIYISRTSEDGVQYNKVGITVSKNEDCTYDESSGTYNYLTGKFAQINISISNQNAADEYKYTRIYFRFYDSNGNLSEDDFYHQKANIGQDVGTFKLRTEYSSYDVDLVKAEQDGLYYYDFSPVNTGDALSYTAEPLFSNFRSGGGNIEIWGELAKQKADLGSDDVLKTSEKLNCQWNTKRNVPESTFNSYTSLAMTGNGSSDHSIYVPELSDTTRLVFPYTDNAGGVNFAKEYQFSIVIEPSEDLSVTDEILTAINTEKLQIRNTSKGFEMLYPSGKQIGRFEYDIYSITKFKIADIDILNEETNPKIRITGTITNPYYDESVDYAKLGNIC